MLKLLALGLTACLLAAAQNVYPPSGGNSGGPQSSLSVTGNQPPGATPPSIFSIVHTMFNGGTGLMIQNCASPQSNLTTCNAGQGLLLGDIGVNALLTPGTERIPMGVLRDGWSLLLNRNLKYDVNCPGGPCWSPIITDATYGYATDLLELGAEGVSIHVDPPGFGTNHWGISSMIMSWRPQDVRAPDASGNDTSIAQPGQTIQFHAPLMIYYTGASDTKEYFHNGATRPPIHVIMDGSGINVPMMLDNNDSGHRQGAQIQFRKSGGNSSNGGQTLVTASDNPMQLYSYAYDGAQYQLGAAIATFVSGTPALNSVCQDLRFGTGATTAAFAWKAIMRCSGNFGIGNLTPTSLLSVGATEQFQVDSAGMVKAVHQGGNSTVPAIAAAAGAGTSPTVNVFGNDMDFTASITTGTAPASGNLFTVTFATAYASTPRCIAGPSNQAAAGLTALFSASGSTSAATFGLANAPSASTNYQWYVHCFN